MWVVKCEYCQVACKAQFWLYYGKWKVKRGLRELGPSPYHPDALYPFPMMIITEVVPNFTLWLGVTTWYHMTQIRNFPGAASMMMRVWPQMIDTYSIYGITTFPV